MKAKSKKFDDMSKLWEVTKRYCPICGHSMNFLNKKKKICNVCGTMVYFDKKDEFKEKLEIQIKKASE